MYKAYKKWDNGPWKTGTDNDERITEGAFAAAAAYDRCEDVKRVTDMPFEAEGKIFESIRIRMERGKWYGANPAPLPCGQGGQGKNLNARSELPTSKDMHAAKAAVGFAFRYNPDCDDPCPCKHVIYQRHVGGPTKAPLSIRIRDKKYFLEIVNDDGIHFLEVCAVTYREWDRIVIMYNLSTEKDGYCHLWINGDLKKSFTGQTMESGAKVGGVMKWGFYASKLNENKSCVTPDKFQVWEEHIARIIYGPMSGTMAEVYPEIDPFRIGANEDYPDGSSTEIKTYGLEPIKVRARFELV